MIFSTKQLHDTFSGFGETGFGEMGGHLEFILGSALPLPSLNLLTKKNESPQLK